MARIINSPGVQITEKDLSLRAELPVGTVVVVPGFAPQGPISEPLFVTTMSELESIYGLPTTPAEKYFYYSCKEVLNSPAILNAMRLPYGSSYGEAYSEAYSGLFYPMTSGTNAGKVTWTVGAPKHYSFDPKEYTKVKSGDFDWSATFSSIASVTTVGATTTIDAGFFILNDLQVVNNEVFEGYYIGFADNSAVASTSPNFDSITQIKALTANNDTTAISSARLEFVLSATKADADSGLTSVSESLEKVGFIGFETNEYQDHLSLGVFKIRRSTSDPSLLSLASIEKYLGSLDSNRKQTSPSGGTLVTSFIEDKINENSPTIKIVVNPAISKQFDWNKGSTTPVASIATDASAKGLYPLGVYVPDTRAIGSTKIIGDVPTKLNKSLRTLEVIEDTTVDLLIDAGLSTIYSMTQASTSKTYFNDELVISDPNTVEDDWQDVANELVNFSQNTRRDCFTILDPHRSIFVTGKDSKVAENQQKTFSLDIYTHLKNAYSTFETNYAATYANWVKVSDMVSGRKTWLPFSGYAAAVFARSDAAANQWAAPAGLNRGIFNVIDIAFNPNQKQRDRLYEISVNPVVFFTNDGYSVMGQKTLQTKPTAFDRVNVRRLFLALERATQRALKYFVFEPNTEFTRNRLRNTILPIFEFAKNTEGLYDYLIVCDDRNNTPDSIDRNELIVDIYLKPVRTAEFLLVNFIATRTGQNFQELI